MGEDVGTFRGLAGVAVREDPDVLRVRNFVAEADLCVVDVPMLEFCGESNVVMERKIDEALLEKCDDEEDKDVD